VLNTLAAHRYLPVCGLRSPAEAVPLADALRRGGLPIIEVTLRSPDALACLDAMVRMPDLVVGAGTVRTAAQLRAVESVGAAFAVSPCLTPSLAAAAQSASIPFIPGVATPSEVQMAVDAGFSTVKFFPAEASGGFAALRALAEVFGEVRFVPTGGLTLESAGRYLEHPQVLAVGGSWMLPAVAREAGDWDAIVQSIAATVGAATP
jgi:2-dehydro-3-deoxyphosphogluconate aldolase/(4S)-4-hydroxy-2-oxoglutarate aldolase